MRYCQIAVMVVFSLFLGFFLLPVQAQTQTDERCFAEVPYCIRGRIREFWEQNGGLPIFGLPITAQREETIEGKPFQVQWFERNRLELHPENQRPSDVLLGRLGADLLEKQGRNWYDFPKAGEEQLACRYFAETGHNVCGDFYGAWRSNGLEQDGVGGISEVESLALFGLPLSGEITETLRDGMTYTVQYFERARFERHPENRFPYTVLLGLLGREVLGEDTGTDQPPAPTPAPSAGKIAFSDYRDDTNREDIFVINADGSGETNLTNATSQDSTPAWSPDGSRIAFSSDRDGTSDIYVMQANGSNVVRLTNDQAEDFSPVWSPDGSRIAFTSRQDGNADIYLMNTDGSQRTRLTRNAGNDRDPDWSPDGQRIVFAAERDERAAIYVINVDGSGETRLTDSERYDFGPAWSPDGQRIAFWGTGVDGGPSGDIAGGDIFMVNADGSGLTRVSSNEVGGSAPAWSPDGARLVFWTARNTEARPTLHIMNQDGSGVARLTTGTSPSWAR